ncbi:MAG: hypothetical protein ACFCU2_06340 [Acidimicrobiia bacterium]
MLAALSIQAVVMGVAAGGLSITLVGFLVGGGLALLDVTNGPTIGLLVGLLVGLVVGGWIAGRMALHSHRFHGSVAGLLLGGLLILLASLGEASASIWNVLLLAFASIVGGGVGGLIGGRRTR